MAAADAYDIFVVVLYTYFNSKRFSLPPPCLLRRRQLLPLDFSMTVGDDRRTGICLFLLYSAFAVVDPESIAKLAGLDNNIRIQHISMLS
jgi:hypothetical protein